jgi:hypothetical protein
VPYKIHVQLLHFEAHNLANTTSKKDAALQVYNSLTGDELKKKQNMQQLVVTD